MKNIQHKIGKISGIYCIKNIVSNKIYIGSSKHIYYRLRRHLSDLKSNIHKNPKLQNSFNKHGEDKFISTIIEETNNFDREEYWMKKLNPFYNCVLKNVGRLEFSEDQKQRISISMKKAHEEKRTKCFNKAVDVFNLKGEKIDSLSSIKEFGIKYNICRSKAGALFREEYQQWKGFRVRPKDKFTNLEEYLLPNKGCMKVTKDKCARLKQGELTEISSIEDNQQPSLNSNVHEGSETNSRVLNKDSNADTSALPFKWIDYDEWKFRKGDDIVQTMQ